MHLHGMSRETLSPRRRQFLGSATRAAASAITWQKTEMAGGKGPASLTVP